MHIPSILGKKGVLVWNVSALKMLASHLALSSLHADCDPLKPSELRDQTKLRKKSGGEPWFLPGRQGCGKTSNHVSHCRLFLWDVFLELHL